jgi:membrane dipeptidase
VNFHSRFIDPQFRAARATPLAVLIDHFDHIAKVAGVDHVGIGSDFDGVSALPAHMEDVTQLPRIAQALLDRGYSEGDVTKILGGNMLRVMEQAMKRGR